VKICVTPTQIVTLSGPSGRAQPELGRTLPFLPGLDAGGAGRFLYSLLAGVVGSYEGIVKTVEDCRLDLMSPEERRRWRKRVEKLIHFLRDEQVFLSNVAREGGKLFAEEEGRHLQQLAERVGVLARAAWEALRSQSNEKGALAATRLGRERSEG
jgi:hypothetical protein